MNQLPLLATDLDGSLLAGTQETRRRIRELFSGGLPGANLVAKHDRIALHGVAGKARA